MASPRHTPMHLTISSSPRRTPAGSPRSHVITIVSTPPHSRTKDTTSRRLFESTVPDKQEVVEEPQTVLSLEYDPDVGVLKTLLMYLEYLFTLPKNYFASQPKDDEIQPVKTKPPAIVIESPNTDGATQPSVVEVDDSIAVELRQLEATRLENETLRARIAQLTEESEQQRREWALEKATMQKAAEKSEKNLKRALNSKQKSAGESQATVVKLTSQLEEHKTQYAQSVTSIQVQHQAELHNVRDACNKEVQRLQDLLKSQKQKTNKLESQIKITNKKLAEQQRAPKLSQAPTVPKTLIDDMEELRCYVACMESKMETLNREKQSLAARNAQLLKGSTKKKGIRATVEPLTANNNNMVLVFPVLAILVSIILVLQINF